MIVPYNDPNLTSGSGNASSSPFVIAIKNAGIPALDSVVNACILISAWSAGNSYCYVGARIIVAMAIDKQAPQFFAKVNRWGVPYYAVIASFAFGPLAYLSCGTGGAEQAFSWLLNLSTVAGLLAWMTLCICFIRFHRACKVQQVDRNTFPMKGRLQPYAAWFGAVGSLSEFFSLLLLTFVLPTMTPTLTLYSLPFASISCLHFAPKPVITVFSGFSVFLSGNWSVSTFIASYIGIPIYIIPLLLWKVIKKTKFVRASTMDLWSGRFNPETAPVHHPPTTRWGKFVDWLF